MFSILKLEFRGDKQMNKKLIFCQSFYFEILEF